MPPKGRSMFCLPKAEVWLGLPKAEVWLGFPQSEYVLASNSQEYVLASNSQEYDHWDSWMLGISSPRTSFRLEVRASVAKKERYSGVNKIW